MSPAIDVTLVTYADFPDLTPDDQLLRVELEALGVRTRAAVWSDPSVDWSATRFALVRSTWDYFHRVEAFRRWVGETDQLTQLVNSAGAILWNMDKHYLHDLESRGVAIVPTRIVRRGSAARAAAVAVELGSEEIVIKPTISGSAFGTRRFALAAEAAAAERHLQDLLVRGDAMVQPFLEAVFTEAERSLVFLGGGFSHAFLRTPFSAGAAGGQVEDRGHVATDGEIAFARRVLAAADQGVDYARVDVVPSPKGPLLMELELIEPALKFALAPGGAGLFARHLRSRLTGGAPSAPPAARGARPPQARADLLD